MDLKKLLVLIAFMAVSFNALAGSVTKLLPVDEAERDLSLVEFRKQMLQSIRYHEPETFLAMVDENVSISLSRKHGMRDFVKKWQPESSDTELWAVMESILTMGGGFIRSERGVEFCAPYVFTHFPEELDIYGYGAVIKQNVPLKTDSAITSQTVSNLSYDLVPNSIPKCN